MFRKKMSDSYLDKVIGEHALLSVERAFPPAAILFDDITDDVTGTDREFVLLSGRILVLHQHSHCKQGLDLFVTTILQTSPAQSL